MKLRNPWAIRVVAVLAAGLIRIWMSTVRYRIINRDRVKHPADADHARFIYAFWHESILGPVRFKARVHVLISQHADGELIARACRYLGFGVVRGSTTRGGSGALKELWDCSTKSHLVFTPDGPRGPRREVQQGMVVLASKTGLPIVPVGLGYRRCWRARSWDRFAIPKPFTRCVCVIGEAIEVPAELDREELNRYKRLVTDRMLAATVQAENEARAGTPRPHLLRNQKSRQDLSV